MFTVRGLVVFGVLAALLGRQSPAAAITIETVPIGNPGNAGTLSGVGAGGYGPTAIVGAVPYSFRMGTYEVTNSQYAAFLNAVAATDTNGLYKPSMGSYTQGGIVRSGSPGSFHYDVKPDAVGVLPGGATYTYAEKPVNFVSWIDTLRFSNWLNNGQPTGLQDASTTEDGAYTLAGIGDPANYFNFARNPGATWFLPTEDEWFKAAYYDPATASYTRYPTHSSDSPNNNLPSADTGNSANYYPGTVDYQDDLFTTGNSHYPMTDVGAYQLSPSAYGTFDQGGNVWEWNATLITGIDRGIRGSSYADFLDDLDAAGRVYFSPLNENTILFGFRVATVPEPGGCFLAGLGVLALFAIARRKRSR